MIADRDASELIITVQLYDNLSSEIADVTFDDSNLTLRKYQNGDSGQQAVTLVQGTLGSYLANSWVPVSAGSNLYQFCPPDSWITPGGFVVVEVTYAPNRLQRGLIQFVGTGTGEVTAPTIDQQVEFFDPETRTISYTRGDDYLTTNCRNIDITLDNSCGNFSPGNSAFARIANDDFSQVHDVQASVIDVGGSPTLRLQANRTNTGAIPAGTYNWDAEVRDNNNLVTTVASGPAIINETWTSLIP